MCVSIGQEGFPKDEKTAYLKANDKDPENRETEDMDA